MVVHIHIHVTPGAKHPGIGGRHGDRLIVRVRQRAVDGEATEAARKSVATALGLPFRSVTVIRGLTSRDKTLAIESLTDAERACLEALRLMPDEGVN